MIQANRYSRWSFHAWNVYAIKEHYHNDVMIRKRFPRNWHFVRESIGHQWRPVASPNRGQQGRALVLTVSVVINQNNCWRNSRGSRNLYVMTVTLITSERCCMHFNSASCSTVLLWRRALILTYWSHSLWRNYEHKFNKPTWHFSEAVVSSTLIRGDW